MPNSVDLATSDLTSKFPDPTPEQTPSSVEQTERSQSSLPSELWDKLESVRGLRSRYESDRTSSNWHEYEVRSRELISTADDRTIDDVTFKERGELIQFKCEFYAAVIKHAYEHKRKLNDADYRIFSERVISSDFEDYAERCGNSYFEDDSDRKEQLIDAVLYAFPKVRRFPAGVLPELLKQMGLENYEPAERGGEASGDNFRL